MQDIGTFSIDELIGKLVEMRNMALADNADPNQFAVYTIGPLGNYRKIQAVVYEEDGIYLNLSRPM